MDHIKRHASSDDASGDKEQCRYCLKAFTSTTGLNDHLSLIHPTHTKDGRGSFKCIICRVSNEISFKGNKIYFLAQKFFEL